MAASGRLLHFAKGRFGFLPVKTYPCTGHIRCKWQVTWDANAWSSQEQFPIEGPGEDVQAVSLDRVGDQSLADDVSRSNVRIFAQGMMIIDGEHCLVPEGDSRQAYRVRRHHEVEIPRSSAGSGAKVLAAFHRIDVQPRRSCILADTACVESNRQALTYWQVKPIR